MSSLDIKKRVVDLCLARKSQDEISSIVNIPVGEVSKILQGQGIVHTVAKDGIKPIIKGDE